MTKKDRSNKKEKKNNELSSRDSRLKQSLLCSFLSARYLIPLFQLFACDARCVKKTKIMARIRIELIRRNTLKMVSREKSNRMIGDLLVHPGPIYF